MDNTKIIFFDIDGTLIDMELIILITRVNMMQWLPR